MREILSADENSQGVIMDMMDNPVIRVKKEFPADITSPPSTGYDSPEPEPVS